VELPRKIVEEDAGFVTRIEREDEKGGRPGHPTSPFLLL